MSAISEELHPLGSVRPAPPRPDHIPPGGGRTEQFVLSLTGVLPYVYEQAWQTVLDGTPLCRTAFRRLPDGGLRRTFRPEARLRMQIVDWRATRTQVQDARLAERLARESAAGLPLDQAPLMRATLIRRDDRTWTVVWRYARELMDRRAGLRMLEEAAEAYGVLLRGGTPRRAETWRGADGLRGAHALLATDAEHDAETRCGADAGRGADVPCVGPVSR